MLCAQNPLDTFPHRWGSWQLVADLLATQQTILTCQDSLLCREQVHKSS